MVDRPLIRLLRRRVSQTELGSEPGPVWTEEEVRLLCERLVASTAGLEASVQRNRRRAEERYQDFLDLPEGRRQTVLANSPPAMLVALIRNLMKQSFTARFDDAARSLQLAELAANAADDLADSRHIPCEVACDLQAETRIHLGNALRLNSQLRESERVFSEARKLLDRGTSERSLLADYLSLYAILRTGQGYASEAAQLFDQEISVRRSLGDKEKLGDALVNRGWVAAWTDGLDDCLKYLEDGVSLVSDPRHMLLALYVVAERLARDGAGLEAWKIICAADTVCTMTDVGKLKDRLHWIKGITYRALGQLDDAASELEIVRHDFLERRVSYRAALVSLDLAAVRAEQGKMEEVRQLAEEAYAVFKAERLERRALSAFLVLYQAAQAETLSAALARRVANFLVRFQYDRSTKFQGGDEWQERRA